MSHLHISQSAAEAIIAMHLPRWIMLVAILIMVVALGFFLPPVSIILPPQLCAAWLRYHLVRRGHDHRYGNG